MVEIELYMNYFKVNKLHLGRGILDCDNVKKLEIKFQDGKIMHLYREVEDVLCSDDLEADDSNVSDYIDADEELSRSLNDIDEILLVEYVEI